MQSAECGVDEVLELFGCDDGAAQGLGLSADAV